MWTMRAMLFWDISQCIVEIPDQRYETTYWSQLQGSRKSEMMGPIGCPDMLVRNYHYMLCNIPKEHRSHLLCSGSLK